MQCDRTKGTQDSKGGDIATLLAYWRHSWKTRFAWKQGQETTKAPEYHIVKV